MLDQLRIQCPSCGIILDVRNSKHEAIKKIVCPNCKKQLAVNFNEELQPAAPPQPIAPIYYGEMRIELQEGVNHISLPDCDHIELKVVRLKDGNSKCLLKPLGESCSVKVNDVMVQAEEQVVLSIGDYIQTCNTCLTFGKPGELKTATLKPQPSPKPQPRKPLRNVISSIWLYSAVACVVLMVATILLWPKEKTETSQELPVETCDTMVTLPVQEPKRSSKEPERPSKQAAKPLAVSPKAPTTAAKPLSDFELEKKALGGDAEAQYELGNRLVHKEGPSNIIRGIKYLRMATQNGSSKARTVMNKAVNALKQRAERGDSISYYILQAI